MNLKIEDNKVFISFQYDPAVVKKVNAEGLGMKWNKKQKVWYATYTKMFIRSVLKTFPELAIKIASDYPLIYSSVKVIDEYNFPIFLPGYLMDHQKKGVELALKNSRYLFIWDCGTGKTLLAIEIIDLFKKIRKAQKTLILCPLSILETSWVDDISSFKPSLRYVNLWRYKKKKTRNKKTYTELMRYYDIAMVNYECFRTIKNEDLSNIFDTVIFDESAILKNHKSVTTKKAIEFTDNIDNVFLLSGLPAPNDELEYWSQVRICDPLLLGSNFYNFRNKYFYGVGYGNFKYVIKEDLKNNFLYKLSKISNVIKKENVLDLPEFTVSSREVILSADEEIAYKKMKNNLIIEFENTEISVSSKVTMLMKLRQITSGWCYDEERNIVSIGSSKLDSLAELINEIGDHQILIWYFFRPEGFQIQKMISEKYNCIPVKCDGTINQNEKIENINLFKDKKSRILIANPASIGHGVTLTTCSYIIYYSQSHSLELYEQSFARTHRKGQTRGCNYYHLIAKNTLDSAIYRSLKYKKNLNEEIINYIKDGYYI